MKTELNLKTDHVQTKEDEVNEPGLAKNEMNLLTVDELAQSSELSGVFCKGVQYYDFKDIKFINNSGLANLIGLLKSLLKQGIRVQFVNVSNAIKEKVKAMGLEKIINCN